MLAPNFATKLARNIGFCLALLTSVGVASCAAEAPERRSEGEPETHATATAAASVEAAPTESATPTEETAQAPATAAPPDEPWKEDLDGPRIGSIGFRTWVWNDAIRSKDREPIGALRVGTSVRLKSEKPIQGQGCNDLWYEIEPYGYVCADASTTRNFKSVYWKALASQRPKKGVPYPYRYAFSMGAPMYARVPTPDEQKSSEFDMGPTKVFHTLGKWSEGHERLISTDEKDFFKPDGPVPEFFHGNEGLPGSPWGANPAKARIIPAGSGFAYSRVFEASGRLWLMTPDLMLIPADRVWPYMESEYQGVELDDTHTLPLAWVRDQKGAPKYRRAGDVFEKTSETFPIRKPIYLTDNRVKVKKTTYCETVEGDWIADDDSVSIVEKMKALKHNIGADERWIEASILGGTMTAFIGLKPVYATMWSPGIGGVPVKGQDGRKFATTEVGIFPLEWKDAVETMSPDKGAPTVFWFADVPWIQYVHKAMALHVSYWHENFGYPMSAECLNVSARDGMWLFNFTLPKLPEGWGSVGAGKRNGPSTRINITP
ncbi:MAG: L,D-transpeptidase [Polyangiaceae bacterium]